jgi:hypothetical protein
MDTGCSELVPNSWVFWHPICFGIGEPEFTAHSREGDEMKALFSHAGALAAAVILCSELGMAQNPPASAVAVNAPRTRAMVDRTSGYQGARAKPVMNRTPNERARDTSLEPPGRKELTVDEVVEPLETEGAAAILRPTWDRGFWVLPPGGLTRFLIPSRAIINVDVAPVKVTASEACPPP